MSEPLDIVVPLGRDPFTDFASGVPALGAPGHPPINFHAFAAATGGSFHDTHETVRPDRRFVLVLVPRRAGRALDAAAALKQRGHRVLCTWKECGAHQIAAFDSVAENRSAVEELRERVDAWVVASPAAREACRSWPPSIRTIEMATPYPLDVPGWSVSCPLVERRGILVGTRDWDVPSRRHESAVRLAVAAAAAHPGGSVTIVNGDGLIGRLRAWRLRGRAPIRIRPRLPYPDYLRLIAEHRVVLQRDQSGVPGQVAGDCLLAGTPCLGGDGMIDRMAFADLPGGVDPDTAVLGEANRLLVDDARWTESVASARASADRALSFAAFRRASAEITASWEGGR